MKTPDEILTALDICDSVDARCEDCPYNGENNYVQDRCSGAEMMRKDAAALIRQLTAERDAALHDIDILRNKPLCAICDYGYADRLPECRERYDKRGVHKCYKWRGLCAENSGG